MIGDPGVTYTSEWIGYISNFVQAQVPFWILWGHNHGKLRPQNRFAFRYSPPEIVIQEAQARSVASTSLILPTYRYDPFAINQGIPNPFPQNDSEDSNEPVWALPPPPFTDESSGMSPSMPAPSPSFSPSSSSKPLDRAPSPSPSQSASSLKSKEVRKRQALAALEEFFENVERLRRIRLENEMPTERQTRIAREDSARNLIPAKNSTVYVWREQDDGTYRREQVNQRQVSDELSNFTRNQRRFTGHLNQWDLCPQLPRYSEENPKEAQAYDSDDSEYESDNESFPPPAALKTTVEIPNDQYRGNMDTAFTQELHGPMEDRDAMEEDTDRIDESRVETFDFETFLLDRFGYDLMSPLNWNSEIEPTDKGAKITLNVAKRALSYQSVSSAPNVGEALLRLVRLLSNTTWTFSALPASFDHSPNHPAPLSLASNTLDIDFVTTNDSVLYLVHRRGHADKSPWSIITSDPSTVLLIFRKQWLTVEVIARELVRRGAPFRTVSAVTVPPAPLPYVPSRGLGARPGGYKPTVEDYDEYVRRRNDFLRGPKGRAALLRGGIVARIARDVLECDTVLDGPSGDARPFAKFGRFALVDDELTQADLDIICGVYYVKTEFAPKGESFLPGTRSELSWWPQDHTWTTSRCYLKMEWTELAEDFYQRTLTQLRTAPETGIRGTALWKQALRKNNAITDMIEAGTTHYQAGYLEDHHHRTRFVAKRR
ncbi:hypothetical protein BJ912DRAFT_1061700 [Pholiota molesta]|nr:hypothetical protein BJ912DRAFT_1061700 [Pholiota molesta]